MGKPQKVSGNGEKQWKGNIGQKEMWKILEFVTESDEEFFRRITEGLTDEEIEEYLQEFPEYRVYWKKKE